MEQSRWFHLSSRGSEHFFTWLFRGSTRYSTCITSGDLHRKYRCINNNDETSIEQSFRRERNGPLRDAACRPCVAARSVAQNKGCSRYPAANRGEIQDMNNALIRHPLSISTTPAPVFLIIPWRELRSFHSSTFSQAILVLRHLHTCWRDHAYRLLPRFRPCDKRGRTSRASSSPSQADPDRTDCDRDQDHLGHGRPIICDTYAPLF